MTDTNAAVAVYDNHSEAEDAVKELQKSDLDMKKLSIVGRIITPRRTSSATTMRETA